MQNKRYWASISIDGIKDAMSKFPQRVKSSEQYGKQLNAGVKFWEDGTASISVYDAETKQRVNIGKILINKEENAPQAPAAPANDFNDDAPF